MKNAEWMIKNGYDFYGLNITQEDEETYIIWYYDDKLDTINLKENKSEALLAWLDMKHKELEILDDVERKYLAAVIKPFRNEVKYISKSSGATKKTSFERIEAKCRRTKDGMTSWLCLPVFEAGTMYKGMKTDREYTLEELGL